MTSRNHRADLGPRSGDVDGTQAQRAEARSTVSPADAEALRTALIAAAVDAWESAGIQGLCADGRFEVAIGALRTLDLAAVTKRSPLAP